MKVVMMLLTCAATTVIAAPDGKEPGSNYGHAVSQAHEPALLLDSDGPKFQSSFEAGGLEGLGLLELTRESDVGSEDYLIWERVELEHALTVRIETSGASTEVVFSNMTIAFDNPRVPTWVALVDGEARSGVLAITSDRQGSTSGSLMIWVDDNLEQQLLLELPLNDTEALVRAGLVQWSTSTTSPVTSTSNAAQVAEVSQDMVQVAPGVMADHCSCMPINGSCMPKRCDVGADCSVPGTGNKCKWTKALVAAE